MSKEGPRETEHRTPNVDRTPSPSPSPNRKHRSKPPPNLHLYTNLPEAVAQSTSKPHIPGTDDENKLVEAQHASSTKRH